MDGWPLRTSPVGGCQPRMVKKTNENAVNCPARVHAERIGRPRPAGTGSGAAARTGGVPDASTSTVHQQAEPSEAQLLSHRRYKTGAGHEVHSPAA